MNGKIKFVYFDVGGVLCNTEFLYDRLSQKTGIKREHLKASYLKYIGLSCLGALSLNDVWELMTQDLELELNDEFDFLDFFADSLVPIIKSHHLVKDISGRYPLGLLTDIEPGVFEKNIAKGNVPNIKYSSIIKSFEHNLLKPDKRIFQLAQSSAGVSSGEEILYIEDKIENINAAKNFGWNTVHFLTSNPEISIINIRRLLFDQ